MVYQTLVRGGQLTKVCKQNMHVSTSGQQTRYLTRLPTVDTGCTIMYQAVAAGTRSIGGYFKHHGTPGVHPRKPLKLTFDSKDTAEYKSGLNFTSCVTGEMWDDLEVNVRKCPNSFFKISLHLRGPV